jgi:hypothetical protein
MYLLYILAINPLVLAVIIYATGKYKSRFNSSRFTTALVGMCLVQIVLLALIALIQYAFLSRDININLNPALIWVFLFSLVLALWATKHIRVK